MNKCIKPTIIMVMILFPFVGFGQNKASNIKLFYLGGQSNMDGHGKIDELPKSLKKKFKDVFIFHGSTTADEQIVKNNYGVWKQLQAGHGAGFTFDGKKNKYSDRFGVELSFARKLRELYPNEKIAIIKYSRGGTSIDQKAARTAGSWDPNFIGKTGINQYDHFLNTVRKATMVSDIDGDGVKDNLIPTGIAWMQGESDAFFTEEIANKYYDNLKSLMALMRAAFRKDNIPIVIGKISDSGKNKQGKTWPYGELVQYAQEKFAKNDPMVAIVRSTKTYGYSDDAHYDAKGYIDLGEKFAEALFQLNNN